jgi:hypothetical protein
MGLTVCRQDELVRTDYVVSRGGDLSYWIRSLFFRSFEFLPETDWRLLKVIGMDNTAYVLMKNIVFALYGQRKDLSMSKLWTIIKVQLMEVRHGTRTNT